MDAPNDRGVIELQSNVAYQMNDDAMEVITAF
jgi:hypothetical protein